MDGTRVARLARYPVKGCAPELLTSVHVDVDGLAHDRELAVVEGDWVLTQREVPALARVVPGLDDATGTLGLWLREAPHAGTAAPVALAGPTRQVRLFGDPVAVVDQSEELSGWLSEVLGRDVRLVGAPPGTRRTSPGVTEGVTVLADEGTVSLHSEASLAALGDRVVEAGGERVPVDRFRANVVLSGCPAHAEDEATTYAVGPVLMRFAQQDARCAVTMVDQRTGEKDGPEPIRTLSTYRRTASGQVVFGVFAAVVTPGVVRVGDEVVLGRS